MITQFVIAKLSCSGYEIFLKMLHYNFPLQGISPVCGKYFYRAQKIIINRKRAIFHSYKTIFRPTSGHHGGPGRNPSNQSFISAKLYLSINIANRKRRGELFQLCGNNKSCLPTWSVLCQLLALVPVSSAVTSALFFHTSLTFMHTRPDNPTFDFAAKGR